MGDMGNMSGADAAGWCELHCHTPFTLCGAGSSIEALVARAAALGMPALAMTDTMTLGGVVRFHAACRSAGIRPITGCELLVQHPQEDSASMEGATGVAGAIGTCIALARDRTGYAHLCGLLTRANLAMSSTTGAPIVPFADLAAHHEGLFLLAGGCDGLVQQLLRAGKTQQARAVLAHYVATFGSDALYLELRHELLPESALLLARSLQLAAEVGIRCVATNGARYATPDDYRVYDLLTCVRLGIQLDNPHPERPRNAERYLKAAADLRPSFAAASDALSALMTAGELAAACDVELLATRCIPPQVPLPPGQTPATYLRALCMAALPDRYPDPAARVAAARQLDHELAVIGDLALEEFFLVVHDIVRQARERRIRCAGRGSAANSLVAYLLGITAVDPLAHHLLFERFLNRERQGMPDIDVDVQSSRREELIQYVEETYTEQHAAMVANVVTYRLRLAVRDVGKALDFPLDLVGQVTRRLPHFGRCSEVAHYADELASVVARWHGRGHGLDGMDGSPRPDASAAADALDAQTRHLERPGSGAATGGLPTSFEPA